MKIKTSLSILLATTMLFVACKKDLKLPANKVKPNTETENKVELFDYTKVPTTEEYAGIKVINFNTLTIDKQLCPSLATTTVGNAIVTAPFLSAPYGLLVKINSVTDDGNKLICSFEETNFDYAFKSLTFSKTIENDGEEMNMDSSTSSLQKGPPVNYTQNLGNITFNHSFVVYDVDGSNSTLYDRAIVQIQGNVKPSFNIKYNMDGGTKHFEVTGNIKSFIQTYLGWQMGSLKKYGLKIEKTFFQKNLPYVTLWIGAVPVVITPRFELKGILEGDIKGKAGVTNECNFNYAGNLKYLNGVWSKGVTGSSTVNNYINFGTSAKAKVKVGPAVSIRFYGSDVIVGAVNCYGYLSAEAHASTIGNTNYTARIRGGIEGNVEGKLDLPNIAYAEVKWTIFDLYKTLWQGN